MLQEVSRNREVNTSEDVQEVCRLIRSENILPWSWLFPVAKRCVSCSLITGGHPEIMAGHCPEVMARLSPKLEHNKAPATAYYGEEEVDLPLD